MRSARLFGSRRSTHAADLGRAFAGLLVAVALSQACGSGNKVSGCPPGPDLCVSYCAHVFSTPCDWPQGAAITCVNECHSAAASLVPADCVALWEAVLTCGSCATVTCARQMCIEPGREPRLHRRARIHQRMRPGEHRLADVRRLLPPEPILLE